MRRLGAELRQHGIEVTKVNFNIGDVLFYPGPKALAFRDTLEEWPAFVRELMIARKIDGLFVFADDRPLHRAAVQEARTLGVRVYAFEEGYLRPNWFTCEEHGINGNSRMPRDPDYYRSLDLPEVEPPVEVGQRFHLMSWYSTLHALAITHFNQGFPHYRHHRSLNAWYQTFVWVRNLARKAYFEEKEKHLLPHLTQTLRKRFWLVPLQVLTDYQILHSPYDDLFEAVREIAETFARHADPTDAIVFKHHPMDRAYQEYGSFFRELAQEHGIEDRLYYVHDLHLPTLLDATKGTITINSTVGLQSMHHGTPVIALGTAVYDMPGLTFQGDLPSFLEAPGDVDMELYHAFRRYLLHVNQANGNLYKRLPGRTNPTGADWFPAGTRASRTDTHPATK